QGRFEAVDSSCRGSGGAHRWNLPLVSPADTPAILDDSRGPQGVAMGPSGVAGSRGSRHQSRHLDGRKDETAPRETPRLSRIESLVVRKFQIECLAQPSTTALEAFWASALSKVTSVRSLDTAKAARYASAQTLGEGRSADASASNPSSVPAGSA